MIRVLGSRKTKIGLGFSAIIAGLLYWLVRK